MDKPRFEFVKAAPEDVTKLGLPMRKTKGSAGYDFVAPKDLTILPGNGVTEKFNTYVKAYIPEGMVLLLFVRSSLGIKKGLVLANGTGVIDSDYYNNPDNEGSIMCALRNESGAVQHIKRGEAFMQGIFVRYETTEDDDAQGIRVGGIGSTNTQVAVPVA